MERAPASPARRRGFSERSPYLSKQHATFKIAFCIICLRGRRIMMNKELKTVQFLIFTTLKCLLTYAERGIFRHIINNVKSIEIQWETVEHNIY
jgi:hypothetical protein